MGKRLSWKPWKHPGGRNGRLFACVVPEPRQVYTATFLQPLGLWLDNFQGMNYEYHFMGLLLRMGILRAALLAGLAQVVGLAVVCSAGIPPSITKQPEPQTLLAGSIAMFSVVAEGDVPLSYFWQRDGTNIFGAPDSPVLRLPNVRVSALITVVVSNEFGQATSEPAALTVNSPPVITAQPASITVEPGQTASFNVMATGNSPLAYQWRFNGKELPGATSPNLEITNAGDLDQGGYDVVVANPFGFTSSVTAQLRVDPVPYLHWVWARKVGGACGEQWTRSVAVGPDGGVYVAGRFGGLTDFGGQTLTTPSCAEKAVFVARFDRSGTLSWVRARHASSDAHRLVVDPGGAVLVAGNTESGTSVAKYDSAGNELWTRVPTSALFHAAGSLAVDHAGNAYLVGYFQQSVTFGSITITGGGTPYGFIAKYSPAGDALWARATGPVEHVFGVTLDADTNIFVTGGDSGAMYIAKYDSTGARLWSRGAGSAGRAVVTDPEGNCYVAGYFRGLARFGSTVLTSAGESDGFLVKYDPSGNVLWARRQGGSSYDSAYDVLVDSAGGVFLSGYFWSAASIGQTNLIGSDVGVSGFIAKYRSNGDPVFTAGIGGPGSSQAPAIALQGDNDLFVAGSYSGLNGTGIAFDSLSLTHDGEGDGYLAKLTGIDLISGPAFTNSPMALVASPGGAIMLSGEASGGGVMTYQWRLNGVDIPGATNSTFEIPSTNLNAAGIYALAARNPLGTATNVAADLTLWRLQLAGPIVTFDIAGPPSSEYRIDYTEALGNGWTALTNVSLLDGAAVVSSSPTLAPARFYRLRKLTR